MIDKRDPYRTPSPVPPPDPDPTGIVTGDSAFALGSGSVATGSTGSLTMHEKIRQAFAEWSKTDLHQSNCAAHGEGMYCCIDVNADNDGAALVGGSHQEVEALIDFLAEKLSKTEREEAVSILTEWYDGDAPLASTEIRTERLLGRKPNNPKAYR